MIFHRHFTSSHMKSQQNILEKVFVFGDINLSRNINECLEQLQRQQKMNLIKLKKEKIN